MTKLNSVIYNKLLLQAEEAEYQGMTKLASNISNAIGDSFEDEVSTYSYRELTDDVQKELWKVACKIIKYYGIESVDAEKTNELITVLADKLTDELEVSFGVDNVVRGPLETNVPGENK
jgi:hypothetical protein